MPVSWVLTRHLSTCAHYGLWMDNYECDLHIKRRSLNSRTACRFRILYKTENSVDVLNWNWHRTNLNKSLALERLQNLHLSFQELYTARCNVYMFPVGWCDTDN